MVSRLAGIDCGTNSIRLLIADFDGGRLRDVHRETRIVRLGQGVDATGEFAADAIARTRAALTDYAALIERARRRSGCGWWPPRPRAMSPTATPSLR